MYQVLFKIFVTLLAINLFAFGVLILFMINARITLRRKISAQKYIMKAIRAAKFSNSTAEAAQKLDISADDFVAFCKEKHLETPEEKNEREDKKKKKKEKELQKIMEEEASWRAEQERIAEERRLTKDKEARERQERLRRFGFK